MPGGKNVCSEFLAGVASDGPLIGCSVELSRKNFGLEVGVLADVKLLVDVFEVCLKFLPSWVLFRPRPCLVYLSGVTERRWDSGCQLLPQDICGRVSITGLHRSYPQKEAYRFQCHIPPKPEPASTSLQLKFALRRGVDQVAP